MAVPFCDTGTCHPTPARCPNWSPSRDPPEPHILCDRDYRIIAANAAYRRSWPEARSVIGRTCHDVSHHYSVPCDQAGETCPLARSLQSGKRERVLHLHHTPRGEEYVNIELTPVRDAAARSPGSSRRWSRCTSPAGCSDHRGLVGRSPAFQRMLELIARVAPSDASVLLQGESGTGKELVAQRAARGQPRAPRDPSWWWTAPACRRPCSRARSSATSAAPSPAPPRASRAWWRLPAAARCSSTRWATSRSAMQVKLLRLLETGTYRRVGSTELRRADIRVVSATHRPLQAMIAAGTFRAGPVLPHQHLSDPRAAAARARGRPALADRFTARARRAPAHAFAQRRGAAPAVRLSVSRQRTRAAQCPRACQPDVRR
jgi:two-component system response regulator HydG